MLYTELRQLGLTQFCRRTRGENGSGQENEAHWKQPCVSVRLSAQRRGEMITEKNMK